MRILFTIFIISLLLNSNSITFAGHANEKYCFNCSYKYKIGDKENDTYEFEFDLQTTILFNYRNSIGRIQTNDK